MRKARKYKIRDLKRTLQACKGRLLKYPNVLSFCIGEKVTEGIGKGHLAIRVLVSSKPIIVTRANQLPKRVRAINPDGSLANYSIPLDVEELPDKLKCLGLQGGDRIKRVLTGATGLVYKSQSGRNYLITNAHIIARPNQRPFNRPVKKRGVDEPIGNVHRMIPLRSGLVNKMDAAIVWVKNEVPVNLLKLRGQEHSVTKLGRIIPNLVGQYFFVNSRGIRKFYSNPNEVNESLPVEVSSGADLLFSNFWILKLVAGSPAVHGDSGSLLVRRRGNNLAAVGIVFAGINNIVAVYPISKALAALSRREASKDFQRENVSIVFP